MTTQLGSDIKGTQPGSVNATRTHTPIDYNPQMDYSYPTTTIQLSSGGVVSRIKSITAKKSPSRVKKNDHSKK